MMQGPAGPRGQGAGLPSRHGPGQRAGGRAVWDWLLSMDGWEGGLQLCGLACQAPPVVGRGRFWSERISELPGTLGVRFDAQPAWLCSAGLYQALPPLLTAHSMPVEK